jgi:hypothetical protein
MIITAAGPQGAKFRFLDCSDDGLTMSVANRSTLWASGLG